MQASNASMTTQSSPRNIVFSHANSFPAGTYHQLFEHWRDEGYTVHAIGQYGHDARYPVTPNWPHLVRQLRDFIATEVGQPAYLVGHSLGGYLSLMLASQHPQWALGVVVMDSPILHGWRSAAMGFAKRMDLMGRVMPSRVAIKRTHEWPSLQAAHQHFASKPKFSAFHPRVLQDYLAHGLERHPERAACRLTYQREIEASIYNTMPHSLLQDFRKHPHRCPLAFIAGSNSRELRKVGIQGARALFGDRISWISGSHLYPMEQPEQTSKEVVQWLDRFQSASGIQ